MTHNNIIFIMCSSAYNHANSIIYDRKVLKIVKNERNLTFGKSKKKKKN